MTVTTKRIPRDSFEFFAKLCRTNTGSHFLDSGGIYGYQYQKPVAKESDPAIRVMVDCGYLNREHVTDEQWERGQITGHANENERLFYTNDNLQFGDVCHASISISLPHFLHTMLTTDEDTDQLQRIWEKWYDKHEDKYDSYIQCLEEFLGFLDRRGVPVKKLGRDYREYTNGCNTYNEDNDLDQDLQFHTFTIDDEKMVAIQPHCGCDIRGGYPFPQIYKFIDEDYFYGWQVNIGGMATAPETPLFPEIKDDDFYADFDNIYRFDGGKSNEGDIETRAVVGKEGKAVLQAKAPWGDWFEVYPSNPAEGF